MRHINVALFAVHEGCPQMCSFCNQRSISGAQKPLTVQDVHRAAQVALGGKRDVSGGEIAFFGGSFTMTEPAYMLSLLQAAKEHIDNKEFYGIRISTRPDGITPAICETLKQYGVTAVELGAQSMDNRVLALNRRGHTAEDVENACKLLQAYGFETGLQMMTGLYGSTDADSIETAKKIIALHPHTVRIYPTVVMAHTELARLMQAGEYMPPNAEQAAELGSVLLPMFARAGIPVIRFGLHSGGGVEGEYVGGAYHPALREMAESRIYRNLLLRQVEEKRGKCTVFVNPSAVSKMTGQKKENIKRLAEQGLFVTVRPLQGLGEYEIQAEFSE